MQNDFEEFKEFLNISSKTEEIFVKKGQILQRAGQERGKGFLVKKGLLRSYTIDEKGKEHIFLFAPENWLANDIMSMDNDSKTVLFIDAIEDSEVITVDPPDREEFLRSRQNISMKEALKLVKRVATLQKRIHLLQSASAYERYQDFIETYPDIVQRVPQKMIASYLGITPQALSKIRRIK